MNASDNSIKCRSARSYHLKARLNPDSHAPYGVRMWRMPAGGSERIRLVRIKGAVADRRP